MGRNFLWSPTQNIIWLVVTLPVLAVILDDIQENGQWPSNPSNCMSTWQENQNFPSTSKIKLGYIWILAAKMSCSKWWFFCQSSPPKNLVKVVEGVKIPLFHLPARLTLLSQLGKVEFYCRLTHAEMPVTRCKFVDAARAMKIYALTKKRPSMTMIIGVSSRGGYVLGVHRRKPQTIHATNEIHDKCATIFISCFMLGKPLQNFTFFLLEF